MSESCSPVNDDDAASQRIQQLAREIKSTADEIKATQNTEVIRDKAFLLRDKVSEFNTLKNRHIKQQFAALTADLEQARAELATQRKVLDDLWTGSRAAQAEQERDEARRDIGRYQEALLKYVHWSDGQFPSCPACMCNLADDGSGHVAECELGALLSTTTPIAADPRDAVVSAAREYARTKGKFMMVVLDLAEKGLRESDEFHALRDSVTETERRLFDALLTLKDAAAAPARGDSDAS